MKLYYVTNADKIIFLIWRLKSINPKAQYKTVHLFLYDLHGPYAKNFTEQKTRTQKEIHKTIIFIIYQYFDYTWEKYQL